MTIKLTWDEEDMFQLTGYRLSLVKSSAENLLKAGGYKLTEGDGDGWVHFTTKSGKTGKDTSCPVTVLCGAVINSETKIKETQMTVDDYHRLCKQDMELMSEGKIPQNDPHFLESLTDSIIKINLLQVKSSQTVTLDLNRDRRGPRDSASKGGAFIQYNISRLAAIRKKYFQRVSEGIYPEAAKPEDVDFTLLKEPEEWSLLFNFLIEFPSIVDKTAAEMTEGKSNVHKICQFLSTLSSLLSVYYRRVRILLEPRDHLLPIIQSRFLLAMSIEQVLENGLALLNITKIEEM